jgi:hypothetical protein
MRLRQIALASRYLDTAAERLASGLDVSDEGAVIGGVRFTPVG